MKEGVDMKERGERKYERTGFQERAPYHPSIDLQTDFVMVYGIDATMPERVRKWREMGYVVHLMTGVAWGQYQEYLKGHFDGRKHWDEAQTRSDGTKILHGSKDVPYMVPSIAFVDFLTERIKVAVDEGVEAIHLEEPEFWVMGGYSDAFKREWEIYYKEPWQAPHESADAQYRASKLKAYLYTRCLDRLCSTLKEYAKVKYGRNLRFYVPTHSLINYSQWRIVSPESRLIDLPMVDGYIAQVWTGTSRTPNVYEGVRKERTFETAFLEYGIMQELVRGTNRHIWFLHDPIEDDPKHTWRDYRENYFKTVAASLFHPAVSSYEVAPWPNRIFNRKYPRENGIGKEEIPESYATVLLTVMNTLADMDRDSVSWLNENPVAGLLMADSGMFQRRYPGGGDWNTEWNGTPESVVDWSPFYGLALPLLKYGLPVRPVQLDNVRRFANYLDEYRLLLLSYEYMKPEYPELHNALAQWVSDGGVLVYAGDHSDPFHRVREWWNTRKKKYDSPAQHLFQCLGFDGMPVQGVYSRGDGIVAYLDVHPSRCAWEKAHAEQLRAMVREAMVRSGDSHLQWKAANHFVLRRGPYVIAAVMNESVDEEPLVLEGLFIDLFDENLTVKRNVSLEPGSNALLYDMNQVGKDSGVQLIAASSRIESIHRDGSGFAFVAKGPEGIQAAARFYCPEKPAGVHAECCGKELDCRISFDESGSTVLIGYPNRPEGVNVTILF